MKRILDFSYADARRFLLKEESYYNFDLPKYFVFQKLLEQISQEIQEKPLSDYYGTNVNTSGKTKSTRPCDYENVNHRFLNNKDGKFAWRPVIDIFIITRAGKFFFSRYIDTFPIVVR